MPKTWMKTLEENGFRFPQRRVVATPEAAVAAAEQIGYPVVLKVDAEGLLHKTEVGGIRLHLSGASEVAAAYRTILANMAKHAPDLEPKGIAVEEELTEGIELFLGIARNHQLGLMVTFGFGGILAEVLDDVEVRTVPLSEPDAISMVRALRGRRLLDGYRGLPSVSEQALVERILAAGKAAESLPAHVGSLDMNPVLFCGADHVVLDAKASVCTEIPLQSARPNTAHLDKFFSPRSVAVIGASSTEGKIGHAVFASLAFGEYSGSVFPVNPLRSEVCDQQCYARISDIPETVEMAVAAIPLAAVPEAVRDCGNAGVRNLIIVSGGGKETGEEGRKIEGAISQLAQELGVRIIGPNCIGVFDGQSRLDTFFQPIKRMTRPPAGPLAILTQSGTVGASLLEKAETLGVSRFASYGNRIDVDEADLMVWLAQDEETRVIASYLEGTTRGRKTLDAICLASRTTPVVIYKAGRSPEGAASAASHTGFFGGTYNAWKGALRQAGAIVVDSVEELFAASKALALQPPARGPRIAMLSNGAGPMIQGLDLLDEFQLMLADLATTTLEKLQCVFPKHFSAKNPLDLTGSASARDYEIGIRALLSDPNVDIVMPWFVFQDAGLQEWVIDSLASASATAAKPVLCGASGGKYSAMMASQIEKKGLPVASTVREWMVSAAALASMGSKG